MGAWGRAVAGAGEGGEGGLSLPPAGGRGEETEGGMAPSRGETLGSRRLGKARRAESHASGAGDSGARTGT